MDRDGLQGNLSGSRSWGGNTQTLIGWQVEQDTYKTGTCEELFTLLLNTSILVGDKRLQAVRKFSTLHVLVCESLKGLRTDTWDCRRPRPPCHLLPMAVTSSSGVVLGPHMPSLHAVVKDDAKPVHATSGCRTIGLCEEVTTLHHIALMHAVEKDAERPVHATSGCRTIGLCEEVTTLHHIALMHAVEKDAERPVHATSGCRTIGLCEEVTTLHHMPLLHAVEKDAERPVHATSGCRTIGLCEEVTTLHHMPLLHAVEKDAERPVHATSGCRTIGLCEEVTTLHHMPLCTLWRRMLRGRCTPRVGAAQ
ncbi:hypothetical protein J6590_024575 [Homalodisca vitripennis]|nr:hypothetical protein J6590_024575 [Homalodisca vitripennis]